MRHLSRLRQHTRASLAVICGAGIIVGTAVTATSSAHAGAAQPTASARTGGAAVRTDGNCIFVGNGVTERTVNFYYVGSAPNPTPIQQVGDTVIYNDDIYDADGTVIGHAVGYVTAVYLQSAGHLITEYHETVQLPQGRLTTTGVMERQAMIAGGTVHLQATGVSGEFAGKYGYRNWALQQPIPNPLTNAEPVVVNIVMCGMPSPPWGPDHAR